MFQRFLKRPDQFGSHADSSAIQDPQKDSEALSDPHSMGAGPAIESRPDLEVVAPELPAETDGQVPELDRSTEPLEAGAFAAEWAPDPEPDATLDSEPWQVPDDEVEAELDYLDDHDEEASIDAPLQSAAFDPVPPIPHPKPRHFMERLRERRPVKGGGGQHRVVYTPQQRLLILDTWQRSGLPAGDFSELVMVSKHTLYKWKKLFEKLGPEGLTDQPRQPREGSRLSEVTRRAILMMKKDHPEWACWSDHPNAA